MANEYGTDSSYVIYKVVSHGRDTGFGGQSYALAHVRSCDTYENAHRYIREECPMNVDFTILEVIRKTKDD